MQVLVSRVRVRGLKRTKSDIIAEQVKDVLKVKNLLDLFLKTQEAALRLNQLDIFKTIRIEMDTAKPKKGGGGHGTGGGASGKKGVEVTFDVKERGRVSGGVGAQAGTQSGDAVSGCGLVDGAFASKHS